MQEYSQLKGEALLKLEIFLKAFVAIAKEQIVYSTDAIQLDLINIKTNLKESIDFFEALDRLNEYRCKKFA